jgi:hypothetical protein
MVLCIKHLTSFSFPFLPPSLSFSLPSSIHPSLPLFLFLGSMGVKLKALHLLGRHTATPTVLLVLIIFEIGSCFMPGLPWTTILLFCDSCLIWDYRHASSRSAIGYDEVFWTFCLGWSRTWILPISASQVARIAATMYLPWWLGL